MPPGIYLLLFGLLGVVRGLITGDEGPPGFSPLKTPVYFPVFPEDFKDFGIRLGGDLDVVDKTGKSLDMPTTTSKPTTTTDRLPINPDGILSHVALEPVTQPPGPSYLTDSYYYLEDHTPKPGSTEDSGEGHGHGLPDRESEKQELQNLNPIPTNPFGSGAPSALALIGVPAAPVHSNPSSHHAVATPSPIETNLAPSELPRHTFHPSRPLTTSQPSRKISRPSLSAPQDVKLRPAFTPIPAPPPTHARVPPTVPTSVPTTTQSRVIQSSSRSPSRSFSRAPSYSSSRSSSRDKTEPSTSEGSPTSRPAKVLVSRRPQFESSRLSALSTTPQVPTRAPPTSYRTPTPPTIHPSTTTSSRSRGYGGRIRGSSAPQPQRLTQRERNRKQEAPVYHTSTKSYRAPSSLYHGRGTTTTVTVPAQPDFIQSDPNIYVPVEYDEEAIPGEAGIDYPVYPSVPDTQFTCEAQEHPGLYADTEAQCQTFHICQEDGRHDSFLCPNGTVFNQQYFVCDWWYNFSCDHATRFYSLNALIYEIPDADKYYKK